MGRRCSILISIILLGQYVPAQFPLCTSPGQTPSTAIPLCNSTIFRQNLLPSCRNGNLFVPGCTNSRITYGDKNPFYFRIYCTSTGTISFTITPNILTDDFNWQLFDITGHLATNIFTDDSLVVSGNWSGSAGLTGASATGALYIQCGYDITNSPAPTFSSMPILKAGHSYLVMVSQQDDFSQNGFSFQVTGGTADISDNTKPVLQNTNLDCKGTGIIITLNKKILCSSIAADGSDFNLTPANANIIAAAGLSCNIGSITDSILLVLDKIPPPANYSLLVKNGTDGNTLVDFCGNEVSNGLRYNVDYYLTPQIDSIVQPNCTPDNLTIILNTKILCSSIALNGSDFKFVNPSVSILSATSNCDASGLTKSILLKLSDTLKPGNSILQTVTGTDGNGLLNECGSSTITGTSKIFLVKGRVAANFNYQINPGCTSDTIFFNFRGSTTFSHLLWTFDNKDTSNTISPVKIYSNYGDKKVNLIVTNDVCTDSVTEIISLGNQLTASFTTQDTLCVTDQGFFADKSTGNIISWYWDFGNGATSNTSMPLPQSYPIFNTSKLYEVKLVVSNGNCSDTTVQNVLVVPGCLIAVPGAFTPNGDGVNDFLYPLNAFKADKLHFKIFNRMGQLVFEANNQNIKWDGTIKGNEQPTGVYVWLLTFIDKDTGKFMTAKGTTVLIR